MRSVISTDTQIKLFPSGSYDEVEHAVNKWLAATPCEVLEIQFETDVRITVMIVYRPLVPVGGRS